MPFTSADGMLSCPREILIPSYIYLRSLLSDGFVALELQTWPAHKYSEICCSFFKYIQLPHSPFKFGKQATRLPAVWEATTPQALEEGSREPRMTLKTGLVLVMIRTNVVHLPVSCVVA